MKQVQDENAVLKGDEKANLVPDMRHSNRVGVGDTNNRLLGSV